MRILIQLFWLVSVCPTSHHQSSSRHYSGAHLIVVQHVVLPTGFEVISVNPHGKGSWSAGYKVETENGGEERDFFLKVSLPPHFLRCHQLMNNAFVTADPEAPAPGARSRRI